MLAKTKFYLSYTYIFLVAFIFGVLFVSTSNIIFGYLMFLSMILNSFILHFIKCPNCGKSMSGFPNFRNMLKGYNSKYSNLGSLRCASCGFYLKNEKHTDKK